MTYISRGNFIPIDAFENGSWLFIDIDLFPKRKANQTLQKLKIEKYLRQPFNFLVEL